MNARYDALQTEGWNPKSEDLDRMTAREIVELMATVDQDVIRAIAAAKDEIARAVEAAFEAITSGGRVIYLGPGTSGRLGVLDASECPPTFGVPEDLFVGIIAGGDRALRQSVENAEDDADAGQMALAGLNLSPRDFVIGLSASGSAPYCLGAMRYGREMGARIACVVCNGNSPMAALSDVAVELMTGPEALSGSTRLKAGTATKMVLNMISTGAMALSGKTYKNLMVDVRATNNKLRDRCVRIVMRAANLDRDAATQAIARADGDLKRAIVMAVAAVDAERANEALTATGGYVRRALEAIGASLKPEAVDPAKSEPESDAGE
jgi:N-acetylmuramic acid 6-phosphate etherase